MWRRRGPEPDAPEQDEEPRTPPAASTPPPPITVPEPQIEDDPYAQLEHFFEQPMVRQDTGPQTRAAAPPPPPEPRAPAAEVSEPSTAAALAETIDRLEQFAKRLATRFEALEGKVEGGSTQTLEALRRLGERMGAELAMLDKRTVNLELTMARLRSTTEALDSSLRKLPDYSPPEPPTPESAAETPPAEDAPAAAETPPAAEAPPAAGTAPVPETPPVADTPSPDEASPPPGALFTLEEEVPPADWDEPPPEDTPPPGPTSP